MEHFQWLSEEATLDLDDDHLEKVPMELADVQLYLIRLADRLGVDLLEAAAKKIEINDSKYPADRVLGSLKKYSEY